MVGKERACVALIRVCKPEPLNPPSNPITLALQPKPHVTFCSKECRQSHEVWAHPPNPITR